MKILFIEDDENVSKLAKEVFIRTTHDVIMCPCPFNAIKVLSVEDFDLVILDMHFSDGNGGDVLQYMKENKINTPVFIHSGHVKKFSSVIDYYKEVGLVKMVYEKPSLFTKDFLTKINSFV